LVELRWNPVFKEWVIVASHRTKRPNLPTKSKCPFCPGAEELKDLKDWKYVNLPNKFPSLLLSPPEPDLKNDGIYQVMPALGYCEIILYSPHHDEKLEEQSIDHISGLIGFWAKRYQEIGNIDGIEYVLIFENRGRDVGVSLDHPHGQIYSFSFIPSNIKRELDASRRHKKKNNECLFCNIIEKEQKFNKRVILENDNFISFIPFYGTWSYGPHIYPKRHVQNITQLDDNEKKDLAMMLKETLIKFNKLFEENLSFEMIFHQEPTDGRDYPHYHFHIEFYVVNRAKDKIKYLGGCELGSGTFINPISPEDAADTLRNL